MSKQAESKSAGWISGFIGVLIFSGSLPATRLAVLEIDPVFLTVLRAAIAGVLGGALLLAFREKLPTPSELVSLALVSGGVVIGFPLFTALALQYVTSAHAIVFIGLLPLSTAVFAVLRGDSNPSWRFWAFSLAGSAAVAIFALTKDQSGGEFSLYGNVMMLLSIIVCGYGYAEGARLSRAIGGWQVICWALVLALPVMLVLAIALRPDSFAGIGAPAWLSVAYVSLFSMLIGFFFWYHGLALGGAAGVGQLQLLQPFFGLGLAAFVLGEPISMAMMAVACVVVVCVAGAKRYI
ncbi:MAG: DMT family transporter [Brucellaceae bacterium]|jgi:drug/metabolite transporter (DMT)-like permease|nr:DMT family transporter [Brucellaceae bacterium]